MLWVWFVRHTVSLTFPESMTYTTSSIVMLVSAILVAMTILRTPGGGRSNTYAMENITTPLTTPTCFWDAVGMRE